MKYLPEQWVLKLILKSETGLPEDLIENVVEYTGDQKNDFYHKYVNDVKFTIQEALENYEYWNDLEGLRIKPTIDENATYASDFDLEDVSVFDVEKVVKQLIPHLEKEVTLDLCYYSYMKLRRQIPRHKINGWVNLRGIISEKDDWSYGFYEEFSEVFVKEIETFIHSHFTIL